MTSPLPVFCGAAPVFVVQDVLASMEHYCTVLGFSTVFTYGEPVFYGGVERGDVTIHFQAARVTNRPPGQSGMNIFVTEVDTLYATLRANGARTLNEPNDRAYGMRDFDVDDLDGNRLTFGMGIAAS